MGGVSPPTKRPTEEEWKAKHASKDDPPPIEPGELNALKTAFIGHAHDLIKEGEQVDEKRIAKKDVRALLNEIPGYEKTKEQEFRYILDETGLSSLDDFDFDEFIEVSTFLVSRDCF